MFSKFKKIGVINSLADGLAKGCSCANCGAYDYPSGKCLRTDSLTYLSGLCSLWIAPKWSQYQYPELKRR